MGGNKYSSSDRHIRATTAGYYDAPVHDVFKQQRKKMVHKSMDSKGITLREARDSEVHPNSYPIILALDLTGSMGYIPHELVKDGLPKIMSGIIQSGIPDPALLFLGIGDHEYDKYPLQIGQFESGDKELDMWLTRTYLEGGGGGNAGESYSLAHYFAAKHCQTDHWDKRKKKGLLITIGDEPNLMSYPNEAMREIMGNGDISTFTDKEILKAVQERWEVYHIYPKGGWERETTTNYWKQLLNDRFMVVDNSDEVVTAIKNIAIKHGRDSGTNQPASSLNTSDIESDVIDEPTEEEFL